jgi:protein TorT
MKRLVASMRLLLLALLFISLSTAQAPAQWYPYGVEAWDPAFDMSSPRTMMDYTPLEKASKKWNVCVSFPHM